MTIEQEAEIRIAIYKKIIDVLTIEETEAYIKVARMIFHDLYFGSDDSNRSLLLATLGLIQMDSPSRLLGE
jgi:hypothetical protein